jgi:hypothetical protein
VLALAMAASWPAASQTMGGVLREPDRIALPGIQGRIDHLAIDLERRRLYVAALGAGEVEFIDLDAGRRVARLRGLAEVQGLAVAPASGRLFVAAGGAGRVEAFEHERRVASAGELPDADNLRLPPPGDRLFAGFGDALAILDAASLRVLGRIALPGHPEAFEPAAHGPEVYVNVPEAGQVVVVDRVAAKVLAAWSIGPEAANFPMALDEPAHRLFVGTRRPARLLAYDTSSGRRVAEAALCGDVDDLFLDAEHSHVLAVCGEGAVDIFARPDETRLERLQRVPTSPGARTGLFVPALKMLFVAAPAHGEQAAAILAFRTDTRWPRAE